MKKIYLVLLVAVFLSACEKDRLKVETEQTFIEQNVSAGAGILGFGGVILTLRPNDSGDILLGGDISYRIAYKIRGDKLIVSGEGINEEFKIVSETELRYKNDRVLKLNDK